MKKLLILLFVGVSCLTTVAQGTKPATKPAATKPAVKVPVVTAYWGTFSSGTYTILQLKNMLDNSLILKDDKGVKYSFIKCSFLYKRKMVAKDDETGKTTVSWEYAEKILKKGEQLDEFWKKTIKEELQEGEELIFGGILAQTNKGYAIPVSNITFVAKK